MAERFAAVKRVERMVEPPAELAVTGNIAVRIVEPDASIVAPDAIVRVRQIFRQQQEGEQAVGSGVRQEIRHEEGRDVFVLGDLSFDDKGDVTLPGYVFYEWKGGTYDYLVQ